MTDGHLSVEDVLAGLFLLLYGSIGIFINLLVCWPMCQMCNEIVGFRFLLSQVVIDILLMIQVRCLSFKVNYDIINFLSILIKK
uniref:G-protein coupled receptors family 1 profile domain-containing protein n=1 Tax=Ascaris lumbricoides TaxID=6252 RepID=A0A0M3HKS3_ASCLU